ncbi:MAG TPA: N,N-dimethylformamidase beta subunit family domain-containing protein, partial [Puia sp.]|nr:N,N-dimethylformamidase beta subunit family domain-containing protein [Puia sp.]
MPKTLNHYSNGIKKYVFLFLLTFYAYNSSFSQNAIVSENLNAGVPASQWDLPVNGDGTFGDQSILGFGSDISVNKGSSIDFKITVTSGTDKTFGIKIYRIGYYQGNGARLMADLGTAFTGITQAACNFDNTTGLTDCGNWTTTASWAVPSTAVSGIYVAKLTRSAAGGGGSSHIAFIVRDDASSSAVIFKTSDATWQAYNGYGGYSLYIGPGLTFNHGKKVSYNRPFITRSGGGGGGIGQDWFMNAEYPMIRFLENNGYDLTYTTDLDIARNNANNINLLLNHSLFLSVGHDEYWSKEVRNSVESVRAAGKNLAFFSGNECYWKTRWENSIDGNNTPYRTMVCYKEGTMATAAENPCGGKCDPSPEWTGLWRDGCSFPSGNACKPENALSGEISWDGITDNMQVPATFKNLRFWRNAPLTSLGTGQVATLTTGTLGYEWDWEQFPASLPPGRITMSYTLSDQSRVHKLSFYKSSFGGKVFGAGSVQWSWGLDATHDRGNAPVNQSQQQATINLFADMGTQPGSLQTGLIAATASTDVIPPVTTITTPANGTTINSVQPITISGTATDANQVGGVELSFDGGVTWSAATGTNNWTYSWAPPGNGTYTILARGIDDSGNYTVTASSTKITITIAVGGSSICPCTVLGITTPTGAAQTDNSGGIVLGMKFRASANGTVSGIRFYKSSNNGGSHTGLLYNTSGTLLASAVFTGETASGWQQVNFSAPVSINGGQTYVAAYFSSGGYYNSTNSFFTLATVSGPLTGLQEGTDGTNGVYVYSNAAAYPTNSFMQSNYWVDLVYNNTLLANAGVNQTITLPTSTVTLNANGSTGNITSYAWTLVSGPNTPTITTPT